MDGSRLRRKQKKDTKRKRQEEKRKEHIRHGELKNMWETGDECGMQF